MITHSPTLAPLQSFFLFSELSEQELAMIDKALSDPITYLKGEHLYDQHRFQNAIGLVLCGTVLVQTTDECDHSLVINRLGIGDMFGVAALFDHNGGEYVTVLRALDTVVVRYITQDAIGQLFEQFPSIARRYIEFLSERIRFLNRKIAVLAGGSSVNRLYQYCLSHQQEDGSLSFPDSMTELAHILNMGRSSLYRSLDVLLAQNILTKNGKQYILQT